MKIYLPFLMAFLLISCGQTNKVLDVKILEAKDYDIPAKFEVTYRASITDSTFTEQELRGLVTSFYDLALKKKSKFHSKPTHIFVFVYNNSPSPDGANWVAMQSRVDNKDNPMRVRMPE